MELRTIDSTDAPAFKALRLAALRECPTAFSSSYEEECEIRLAEVAQRVAPNRDRAIFGAFDGGDLVAMVGLQRESRRKLAHKAFVWGVYVARPFRGRGIGRSLLERAVAHAKGMPDLLQVTLGVNTTNSAAIALYESMGFEQFGLERGFLRVDGVLHDELHMVLTLAPRETRPELESAS